MRRLRIDPRFQGIDGIAQGGYLAATLAGPLATRRRATFRAPTPVDTDLTVEDDGEAIHLSYGDRLLVVSEPWEPERDPPPPVSLRDAASARERSEASGASLATGCFSCGTGEDTFRIHPGFVDGSTVFATPYRPPAWTAGDDGRVRAPFLWAPLDCTAGWRVIQPVEPGGERRPAMTGRLGVEILERPEPGADLVVVAEADPAWDGRRRRARSSIYDASGRLVARSESVWIALADDAGV